MPFIASSPARFAQQQLSTHSVPLNEAKDQILMLQNQLLATDKQMAQLRYFERGINATRTDILTRMAFFQSLDAPITRVPVEIISMIFVAFFTLNDTNRRFLRLGLVCKSWRKIMENTPQLWTRFFISPRWTLETNAINRWLNRVGSCPLELTVDFDTRHDAIQPGEGSWEKLARTICGTFARHDWKSLSVRMYGDTVPYTTLSPFIHHLQVTASRRSLEKIRLDIRRRFDRPPVPLPDEEVARFAGVLKAATSLVTCDLPSGIALQLHSSTLSTVPALSLTILGIDQASLPRVLPTLKNSLFMRSLSLDGNGLASPPLGSELILLPSLERLSVSRWEDLSALFGKLQMPKLRSLVIDTVCGQRRTSNLAVAFLKLLHPTSPPLIELDLKAAPLSEKELVLTLEKLPALEILRVANTDKISSTFFNALEMERPRSKSRNPWLCPNLRVLEVGKGCERVSEGLIASLVRARVLEISATIVIEEALGRIKGGSNHVKMLEVAMWEGRDMIRREDANPPVQLIAQPRF